MEAPRAEWRAAEADPSDPYLRDAQTFPRLEAEKAARVAAYGTEERVSAGTLLFRRGDRSVDFFLVIEGTIEIFELDDAGRARVFRVHGERQFTGELDLFNDRQVLVSARTGMASRVIRVPRPAFRQLMTAQPDIAEIIMRALILRRVGLILHQLGGVTVVGPARGADTLRLERFLVRNGYPHRVLDPEGDLDAAGVAAGSELTGDVLPVVVVPGSRILRNPSTAALADALGIAESVDPLHVHDVVVVGAGPAGLAAAVYAASEGLDTLVIEALAPGGQAGTSSRIENYLGFPTGISGQALAGRAHIQAQKFGARLLISRAVVGLDCQEKPYRMSLEDGRTLTARTVVIATGARYRKLDVPGMERFEGQGIHYAATAMEAQLCSGDVVVVGGGNSAGQAAVFLSRYAQVHLLVRSDGLAATMSDYLVQRIRSSARITLHTHSEITAVAGESTLREVTWVDRRTGQSTTVAAGNIFVMIGAEPNTAWLRGCVELDAKGFVRTGAALRDAASAFETSRRGIYAVGDVRSGSVKRVASSVGEGSVVVQSIHAYLNSVSAGG